MPPLARTLLACAIAGAAPLIAWRAQEQAGVTYEGAKGSADTPKPGSGKKIVLLAGDEEYRSPASACRRSPSRLRR